MIVAAPSAGAATSAKIPGRFKVLGQEKKKGSGTMSALTTAMKNVSLAALLASALCACGGGGGGSGDGSTAAQASSPTPPSSANFTTRCSQPGVLKCVGFDSPADISGTYGDNQGILSGATTPTLDLTVRASGASSLKMTIPSNSPADTSGSFFTNFSNDLATQFSEN